MIQTIRNFVALHRTASLLAAGAGCLGISALLLFVHARAIAEVKGTSMPLVAEIPQLERRVTVLNEQMELAELASATRVGSQEERIHSFVLPERNDLDHIVASFGVISDVLKRNKQLSFISPIEVGDPMTLSANVATSPVSIDFSIHENGMETILFLTQLAGYLTVGDVLTEEEMTLLVDRVEQENPTSIVALEQFFSVDLLKYAQEYKQYEEQLKRSFSSASVLNTLQNVLRTSQLNDVRRFLGSDLGSALDRYKLWPLQFMTVDSVDVEKGGEPGWYKMRLNVLVHSRGIE